MYYEPNTHKTKTISTERIPSNNWWIDQNSYLSFDSYVGIFISVWIVSKYYLFSRPNIKMRKMMMILYSQNILHCFFKEKKMNLSNFFINYYLLIVIIFMIIIFHYFDYCDVSICTEFRFYHRKLFLFWYLWKLKLSCFECQC